MNGEKYQKIKCCHEEENCGLTFFNEWKQHHHKTLGEPTASLKEKYKKKNLTSRTEQSVEMKC